MDPLALLPELFPTVFDHLGILHQYRFVLTCRLAHQRFLVKFEFGRIDLTSSLESSVTVPPNVLYDRIFARANKSDFCRRHLHSLLIHSRHLNRLTRRNPLTRISDFPALQHLRLFYCENLTSRELSPVEHLTQLVSFEIPGAERIVQADIVQILRFHTKLQTLDLSHTQASKDMGQAGQDFLDWLFSKQHLTSLGLDGVSDLNLALLLPLASQLTSLSLRRWRTGSDSSLLCVPGIAQLDRFSKLTYLALMFMADSSLSVLRPIQTSENTFTSLRSLRISYPPTGVYKLKKWPFYFGNLQHLRFDHTPTLEPACNLLLLRIQTLTVSGEALGSYRLLEFIETSSTLREIIFLRNTLGFVITAVWPRISRNRNIRVVELCHVSDFTEKRQELIEIAASRSDIRISVDEKLLVTNVFGVSEVWHQESDSERSDDW